jgi:hypothetical protein
MFKYSIDYEYESKALEIVKKFIIERKRIVFGGYAIDKALRLKGDKIYDDDEKPDIDIYSPDSVKDAYDMVDILKGAGFTNVAAIRGVHVQTMRVRTNFIYVLDIGYVPKEYYDNIPTLNFNNIRVVHPNYQRMDMHISFSFPFGGAPRENMFNRWEKDYTRLLLLNKYYPIESGEIAKNTNITIKIPEFDFALTGFAAYGAIYTSLIIIKNFLKDANFDDIIKKLPKITISASKEKIAIDTPEKHFTVITTDNLTATVPPFGDKIPAYTERDNMLIYVIKNQLLAANIVKINEVEFKCVNIHYILLYMLSQYFKSKSPFYLTYYNATWQIMEIADTLFRKHNLTTKLVNSPFSFNTTVIGEKNIDNAYLVRMAKNIRTTHDKEIPDYIDPKVTSILEFLPKEYYDNRPDEYKFYDKLISL